MKKGYIVLIILLFAILGLGYLYYSKTELNWNEVDKLDFKEDEYSKLSLIVVGDKTYNYDFYEKDSQIGIRKKNDNISYVTIGKDYWLSSLINDTRKEFPITKYKNTPGIIIKDSYTKEIHFIKWERELANSLCEIIKDDDMGRTCTKYKDYNYKTDDFLEFANTRKELTINKELIIKDTTYKLQEDVLIYKEEKSNKKVLVQKSNEELDTYINKAKEEGTITEEKTDLMLYENNTYYSLNPENNSTKELLSYFAKMGEVDIEDFYNEEQEPEVPETYVDYNYTLEGECLDIKDYNYSENTIINIYDIYINNTPINFKYQINGNKHTTDIYVNKKPISHNDSVVPILTKVCIYNNYLMYVQGWEGSPTFTLVNNEGKIVHHFIGRKVNYNNGILEVEEINKNDIMNQDDNKLETYEMDLTKDDLTKNNLVITDFPCEKEGPGYDC